MTQLYPDGLTFRVLEVVFAIIAAKLFNKTYSKLLILGFH